MNYNDFKKQLGNRIEIAIQNSGKTYSKVAHECDMDSGHLWRYRAGNLVPSAYTLAKIAKSAGTTMDWLCGLGAE